MLARARRLGDSVDVRPASDALMIRRASQRLAAAALHHDERRLLLHLQDVSTAEAANQVGQVPVPVVQVERPPVESQVHAVHERHVPRELEEVEVQQEADLSEFLRDE